MNPEPKIPGHAQGPMTRSQSNPLSKPHSQPNQSNCDDADEDLRTPKHRKIHSSQVSAGSANSSSAVSTTSTPISNSQRNDPKNDVSSNEQLETFLRQFCKAKKLKTDLMGALKVIISTEESVLSFMHILKHISDPNFTLASKEFWARVPPSDAVYRIVAAQVGLPIDNPPTWDCFPGWDALNLDKVLGRAPLVLHKRVIESFIDAIKTLPSSIEHDYEAVKVALLTAPLQTIVGYFGGKIMNFPERCIPSTQISKAGRIEDQWYTAQLVIFVREIEKQLTAADLRKYIAQLMIGGATSHLNEAKGFRALPVYCILTDAKRSQVLRYMPHSNVEEFGRFARFLVPDDLTISGESLNEKIHSLTSGLWINMYFSIFLEGYCASTQAFYDLSVTRLSTGDTSPEGSHRAHPALIPQTPVPPPLTGPARSSTEGWYRAAELANRAQLCLVSAKKLESEKQAEDALSYLKDSIRAWPHGDIDDDNPKIISQFETDYLNRNKDTGKSMDVVETQKSEYLKKVEKFRRSFFKSVKSGRSHSHHAVIAVVEGKIEDFGVDIFIDTFIYNEATREKSWLFLADAKDRDPSYPLVVMQVTSDLVRLSGDGYWCEQAEHLRSERERLSV